MESVAARYRRLFGQGRTTERLEFFSDAVFAIALTLLVIDLRVPEGGDDTASGEIIAELVPGFLAYALSFLIIALNWMGHHRKFQVIERWDTRFIWLDFLLLFLIAFVPFPTSLLSDHAGEVPAVVLYASVVGLLNLVQLAMWRYAYRHGLMRDDVDEQLYRYVSRSLLEVPAVFGLSIVIALVWDASIAMYSWFLLLPVGLVRGALERRAGRRSAAA
jgi:uncharacterized membrane protein